MAGQGAIGGMAGRAAAWNARLTGGPLLAIVLALIAALPPLLATYPAMGDYPAHLAEWAIAEGLGRDPWLTRWYAIDGRIVPNLGANLVVHALALLGLPLETAGRLLVIAIPVATGLGLVAVDRALGRRGGLGAILAMCTIWAPALLMGFVNFGLSVGVALLACALWLRLERKPWRPVLFLLLAPLVWLCHLSGWGLLGVMVFGIEWERAGGGIAGFWRGGLRTWPLWPPAALTLLAETSNGGTIVYGDAVFVDKIANWVQGLSDRNPALDLLTVLVLVAVPALAWARQSFDWRMGRPALLLAGLSLALPRFLGGGDYADYRLVPLALMCGALAIRAEGTAWTRGLACIPFVLRLGLTTAGWMQDSAQISGLLAATDHIPRGARVAAAFALNADRWQHCNLAHIQSYAAVRRSALVNSHYALPGVHLLQVRAVQGDGQAYANPSQMLRTTPGAQVDLMHFRPAASADWLWYIGPRAPSRLPQGAQVVWSAADRAGNYSLVARLAIPSAQR